MKIIELYESESIVRSHKYISYVHITNIFATVIINKRGIVGDLNFIPKKSSTYFQKLAPVFYNCLPIWLN